MEASRIRTTRDKCAAVPSAFPGAAQNSQRLLGNSHPETCNGRAHSMKRRLHHQEPGSLSENIAAEELSRCPYSAGLGHAGPFAHKIPGVATRPAPSVASTQVFRKIN